MKYLNLGCGSRFHPDWINIDFNSTSKCVISHNLTQGIPFPDDFFDVVYHSHLLEHFSKRQALPFLKECYRVLKSEGIIRVVVPDLEQIVTSYLLALDKVKSAKDHKDYWDWNYDWILLEIYDQTVRNSSGGEMLSYLSQTKIPNLDFIIQRCGVEAENIIKFVNNKVDNFDPKEAGVLKKIYRFIRYKTYRKELLLKLILKEEYQNLQIGRFRQSGEIHQWMYDTYSLSRLLRQSGFDKIIQRKADESYVLNWSIHHLDTEPDGKVYKPDSLYMEAIKQPIL